MKKLIILTLLLVSCATPAEKRRQRMFDCTLELIQNEAETLSAGRVCIEIYGPRKNMNSSYLKGN